MEKTTKTAAAHRGASMQPALVRASASARIEGVLFDTELQQTYRNPGTAPLEVLYTFPLPSQAVFLGLQTLLGAERRTGTILARPEAEAAYEGALQESDTPVMVECADDGLLTANLGNLAPGEELVVTLRWAQWLQEEQGRIRAVLPTVVAPRFGAPTLQPQQVPEHSLEVQCPLQLKLEVLGELATAHVSCETHRVTTQVADGRLQLALVSPAALDRDVVFTLVPASGARLALQGRDRHGASDQHVALAAMKLPPALERPGVVLKILVDCSGSMNGDSIASARRALAQVVQRLGPADSVTFSRFGSTVAHDIAAARAGDEITRQRLAHLVAVADASLGGTEMHSALEAVFALPGRPEGADVLLITDAQVWRVAAMVTAARRSGHRIFAIGVGSAPREGLLRQLANATGGACEFATPGESLEHAVDRTFSRIRQQPWQDLRCVWDVTPQEASPLTDGAFGGDTLLVQARFGQEPPRQVRLLGRGADGRSVEIACSTVVPAQDCQTLSRMLAAQRLQDIDDAQAATQIALDYRLLTRHTCCVVVHERALEEKVGGITDLHVVPQMLAAGWAGVGTTTPCPMSDGGGVLGIMGGIFCGAAIGGAGVIDVVAHLFDNNATTSHLLPTVQANKLAPIEPAAPTSGLARLRSIAQRMLDALGAGGTPQHALEKALEPDVSATLQPVIDALQRHGLTTFDSWLVLMLWVIEIPAEGHTPQNGQLLQIWLSDHVRHRHEEVLAALDHQLLSCLARFGQPSSSRL